MIIPYLPAKKQRREKGLHAKLFRGCRQGLARGRPCVRNLPFPGNAPPNIFARKLKKNTTVALKKSILNNKKSV
jgi:hypothetical protein